MTEEPEDTVMADSMPPLLLLLMLAEALAAAWSLLSSSTLTKNWCELLALIDSPVEDEGAEVTHEASIMVCDIVGRAMDATDDVRKDVWCRPQRDKMKSDVDGDDACLAAC